MAFVDDELEVDEPDPDDGDDSTWLEVVPLTDEERAEITQIGLLEDE
jgi:hypothetical protein